MCVWPNMQPEHLSTILLLRHLRLIYWCSMVILIQNSMSFNNFNFNINIWQTLISLGFGVFINRIQEIDVPSSPPLSPLIAPFSYDFGVFFLRFRLNNLYFQTWIFWLKLAVISMFSIRLILIYYQYTLVFRQLLMLILMVWLIILFAILPCLALSWTSRTPLLYSHPFNLKFLSTL
jgi:hypothetical protein